MEELGQSDTSKRQNEDFFLNQFDQYKELVGSLDHYKNIANVLNKEVQGLKSMMDIGNGGVFAYEPSLVEKITAVDLFLDALDPQKYPPNVQLKQGNALGLDDKEGSYHAVLNALLIHHLVGPDFKSTNENMVQCIKECHRVLMKDGKLIIAESCVPNWLFYLQKILFPISSFLFSKFMTHPMPFQYTKDRVEKTIMSQFGNCQVQKVKKGKYIIQLGWKVRSFLTPVETYIFTATK